MTAGDVRRDGLREAVTAIETHNGTSVTPENLRWAATHEALARSWIGDVLHGLADALDAVPDVPPTGYDWREAARYYEDDPSLLVGLAAPVPDVPPDPPAADRDDLARWIIEQFYEPDWRIADELVREQAEEHADALLSSGVLVDAARSRLPADTPAAHRQERLTRDVAASLRITPEQQEAARPLVNELSRLAADTWPELWAVPLELLAIALQSSGVLSDAADVRASALEDAADEIERNARATERQETSGDKGRAEAHNYTVGLGLRRAASIAKRRAQFERDRGTT